MATAQAGWYPDPSGDTTKLRYWDGVQWTDNYTDAQTTVQTETQQTTTTDAAGNVTQTTYTQQTTVQQPTVTGPEQIYPMTESDRKLRLAAFILNIICCVAIGWMVIPLAWGIPMTVRSYGIYKGKKPNTVTFGVCTLIFLDTIGGILLLISNKDD